MGFVFHPISTKYWFLKHYFLFCFPFYKRLVYGTYTISCLPLAYFTFEKNSTSLEKVSRTFWPPMFQLVSLNIFKFHSTWVHSQLRCFKSLSNKFFFFQMTILAHLMHITDLPHCIPSSSNSWSNGWSFDTFKWTPFNWTLDSGSISNHSQLTSFF